MGFMFSAKYTLCGSFELYAVRIICRVMLLGAAVTLVHAASFANAPLVFPAADADWEKLAPEELGLCPDVIAEIDIKMQRAGANGIIVRNGYQVAEFNHGGDAATRYCVQSITKGIIGTMLGLALKEGLIEDIHEKVVDYYPAFASGPYGGGDYTDEISFWHLATASSGIGGPGGGPPRWSYADPGYMQPGVENRYHNDHTAVLAEVLTYLFEAHLQDVLRERVLAKTGGDLDWRNEGSKTVTLADGTTRIPVAAGFAWSWWNAADLARIGWLYANAGEWDGERILDAGFVAESMTASSLPIREWRGESILKQRNLPLNRDFSQMRYGLLWRGQVTDCGRTLWRMSGNGGQFVLVLPEEGIVFVKINDFRNEPRVLVSDFQPLVLQLADGVAQAE